MSKMPRVRPLEECKPLLEQAMKSLADEVVEVNGEAYAVVKPRNFPKAVAKAHLDESLKMDYIRCYTAIHRDKRIELLIHLFSTATYNKCVIKTSMPDNRAKVGSLRDEMPGADWYEREIHEMFGVSFSGLADDDRLLLAADIVGNPLRRDFVDDRPEWMLETREDLKIKPEGLEGEEDE